ncbi:hypothetical protein PFICI_01423 [Pestalotiopsis fici W106-1]|uniref:AB hydrolase-1 domain-containing protein n=1 Tax=Pestalotiopsis fici (strain W106-1 / CGMCC3.15140) TaxID=1229662 RepID=W3XNR3_PESFW|nr:uncharacterized protein PFICI_01423 [Pestalotiopsis fici W106-1]ETS87595.1 hypothetical protein PFICI_01423 [Pestalotiopsis fici W106-1]
MAGPNHRELPDIFTYNGWSIKYETWVGESPQPTLSKTWVVFVHGTPWSSVVFRPVAGALYATGRFNIALYDLPGYGQSQSFSSTSESRKPDTSARAQGNALAALLKHLGLDGKDGHGRPHIVAHDIAGVISLRAHLLHGCDYRSLCLLDTNCVLPWGDKLYNLVRSDPHVFEELPAGVFAGCLRAIIKSARFQDQGLGPEWVDALAQPWLMGSTNTSAASDLGDLDYSPQKNFVRQIQQADDSHTAELLDSNLYPHVRCDVKIIWGEEDEWIPFEKMEKLAEMLGDRLRAFVTIPDAGHLVMLDQPSRVTLEIGRWLEQQS